MRIILKIKKSSENSIKFSIYNLSGVLLNEKLFNSSGSAIEHVIDISELRSGSYLYRISLDNIHSDFGKFQIVR